MLLYTGYYDKNEKIKQNLLDVSKNSDILVEILDTDDLKVEVTKVSDVWDACMGGLFFENIRIDTETEHIFFSISEGKFNRCFAKIGAKMETKDSLVVEVFEDENYSFMRGLYIWLDGYGYSIRFDELTGRINICEQLFIECKKPEKCQVDFIGIDSSNGMRVELCNMLALYYVSSNNIIIKDGVVTIKGLGMKKVGKQIQKNAFKRMVYQHIERFGH